MSAPRNPDLVDEARANDRQRIAAGDPPENANVLDGPALQHLENGTLLRGGRRFDVCPPEGPGAFKWHPDDLRLPLGDLIQRYDPIVRTAFELWARRNMAFENTTVWNWLSSKPIFQPPTDRDRARMDKVTTDKNRKQQQLKEQEEYAVRDVRSAPSPMMASCLAMEPMSSATKPS